jgi:hypothetical protein
MALKVRMWCEPVKSSVTWIPYFEVDTEYLGWDERLSKAIFGPVGWGWKTGHRRGFSAVVDVTEASFHGRVACFVTQFTAGRS